MAGERESLYLLYYCKVQILTVEEDVIGLGTLSLLALLVQKYKY